MKDFLKLFMIYYIIAILFYSYFCRTLIIFNKHVYKHCQEKRLMWASEDGEGVLVDDNEAFIVWMVWCGRTSDEGVRDWREAWIQRKYDTPVIRCQISNNLNMNTEFHCQGHDPKTLTLSSLKQRAMCSLLARFLCGIFCIQNKLLLTKF